MLYDLKEDLTIEQKDSLLNILINVSFIKDQAIINNGDQLDSFYVIISGSVRCEKQIGELFATLNQGDFFGDAGFSLMNSAKGCTVFANETTVCISFGKDSLTQLFGGKLDQIIQYNQILAILRDTPLVNDLNS